MCFIKCINFQNNWIRSELEFAQTSTCVQLFKPLKWQTDKKTNSQQDSVRERPGYTWAARSGSSPEGRLPSVPTWRPPAGTPARDSDNAAGAGDTPSSLALSSRPPGLSTTIMKSSRPASKAGKTKYIIFLRENINKLRICATDNCYVSVLRWRAFCFVELV